MSLIVYFAFFCILASSAALSQVLIGHVSLGAYFAVNAPFSNIDYCIYLKADAFYNSVYQLNWHDLHVKEQKIILLMIRRSQDSVSIKAGSYYHLNMALLTKVKMVSNNYVRLQRYLLRIYSHSGNSFASIHLCSSSKYLKEIVNQINIIA